MKVRIEKGKIKVSLEGELEEATEQLQSIMSKIGSAHVAHPDDPDPRLISCCFSPDNLKKLRVLGAKLDDKDPSTMEAIGALRQQVDEYEALAKRTELIKKGAPADPAAAAYKWKIKPFAHQVPAFHACKANPWYGLFGDTGTGKTGVVVALMDHLIKEEKDWVFFIFCPRHLINCAWIPEVDTFSDGLSVVSLRVEGGTPAAKKKKRAAAFATDADIYVLNMETAKGKHSKDLTKEKELVELIKRRKKEGKKIGIFVDESSKIKSRASASYKMLKRVSVHASRRMIITGAASPNGLPDLWSQFDFLDDGETLQPAFTDYRHDTQREIVLTGVSWVSKSGHEENATKWLNRPGAPAAVHARISKRSIRYRIEDCIDLPPQRFIRRDIEMTKEQERCYEQMREYLLTSIGDEADLVTAKVAAVKMMKLREITGGFIITDDGKASPIDKDAPKMLELDSILEQSIADQLGDTGMPNKIIVWAQYQWECKTLVERYRKAYGARGMFGGISSGEVDRSFDAFKRDDSCRALICHPASVGHGLTLTTANYSAYYSLDYNYDNFYQSYRRMARATQRRHMTTYFLVCPKTIDDHLILALRQKKDLNDMVMDGRVNPIDLLSPILDDGIQASFDFHAEAREVHETGGPPQTR